MTTRFEFHAEVTSRTMLLAKLRRWARHSLSLFLLAALLFGLGRHFFASGDTPILGEAIRVFLLMVVLSLALIGLSSLLQGRLAETLGKDRLIVRLDDDGLELTDRFGDTAISPWSCIKSFEQTGSVLYVYTRGIIRHPMLNDLVLMLPMETRSIAERSQIAEWLKTRRQ